MLNIQFDSAQNRLRNDLKELAIDKLRAHAREAEEARAIPEAVRSELIAFGLPGADGFASSADAVSFCLAAEALAWGDAGIAYAWLASRQVAWIIASCGTSEQKRKWLPRFAEDPFLPASLYMYEGRGMAPSEVETTVRRKGAHFVVDGYKSPVMYAKEAVVRVIVGRDGDGKLIALVHDEGAGAVELKVADSGQLALGACPMAIEARIREWQVPASAALNHDGLLRALTLCRLAHAAVCIGAAAAATRYAGEYAQKRIAFGKPIIAFQGVSFVLADLLMAADAARLSVLDLATADRNPEELEREANGVIAQTNHLIAACGREGVQIMGVAGTTTEHPQERAYRSAAVLASIDFDPLHCALVLS
jgi:alkylation response protein AidB-like acyl-CoA dehydrogenase